MSETTEKNFARVIHDGREFTFTHGDPDDHLIAVMRSSGAFYEAELLGMLAPLVRRGATVIDVGANIGNHSVFFAGVMQCRVIAVEPNPAAAALLAHNIEINGLRDQVEIRRCAVGADRRRGQIIGGGGHNLGTAAVESDPAGAVEIVPLDDLDIEGDVALLKIDVEGGEYDVLSGAMAMLQASKPILVLEIAQSKDYRRIAALLEPLGYVSAGSYNYTPTHVFRVPAENERTAGQLADVAHRLSLQYIDAMERTASVDRRLSVLRQQIGQLAEADKAAATRIAGASERTEALRGEVNLLRSEFKQADTKRLGDAEVLMGQMQRAFALQDAEARQQAGRVFEALDGIAGRLDSLGSTLGGLRNELGALGARMDTMAATVEMTRKAVREQFGLGLELQAIGASEADARLARLEARIEASVRAALDQRLSAQLRQGLADLSTQLAQAIGTAIADRELADEIMAPAGAFDITKALAVLGIPGSQATLGSPAPSGPGPRAGADLALKQPVHQPAATESAPAPAKRDVWFVKGYSDRAQRPIAAIAPPAQPAPQLLLDLAPAEGWERRGWAQGETRLEPGGRISAGAACPRLGFVGPTVDCEGGGLIEAEVELRDIVGTQATPILRLQTEAGFPVGHDFILQDGVTTVRAYAPYRTTQLKLYILLLDAPAGASFRVLNVALRRVDGEAHRQEVRGRVGEPVLVSMATIPGRRDALRDSVASLLVQCDRLRIFLNNYPDVPDFLIHPRIELRRSQDWDDRGDAGKFYWIDKDRDESGYRLTVDDDLIFPPDFVDVMTGKVVEHDKRAIVSMHGVLLRQPLARFYDASARAATFHFGYDLPTDRAVHIGGTGVMCFHSSTLVMSWSDFQYCNSADIWVALHAQRNRIPIITPARRKNWIKENKSGTSDATIYDQSLKRTRTRFDSSSVQDAVLRHAGPLTLMTSDRAKIAIVLVAETADGLQGSVAHWLQTAAAHRETIELVVILAYDGADAALAEAVAASRIPHETHLLDLAILPGGLGARLDELSARLGIEGLIAVREQVRLAMSAGDPGGLGAQPDRKPTRLWPRAGAGRLTGWSPNDDGSHLAFAFSSGERGQASLAALLGEDRLTIVGLPPKRRRKSFGLSDLPLVAAGSAVGTEERSPRSGPAKRPHTVNDVFKRVVVLNLDRRPDRWQSVSQRLETAGIIAERFSAIDGAAPAVAEEYAAYAKLPLHKVSAELPGIAYSQDLYMGYASQMARIAHLEQASGRKAIASAGAWGYLRSYEAILERSLEAQDETLLVFDDDVVFHADFRRLFDEAIAQLPEDWLVVQFGTLQYNWDEPWAQWRTPMLYQTNGAAIGSHAVGMRFEILPFLLDHTKRMDLPYDIGPLSAATRAFPDRCFVIYPNLAIQSLECSDIGTSDFQKMRSRGEVAAQHRWNLDDYIISARPKRALRP